MDATAYATFAALASAAMLAAAHAFERIGGYQPCPLCLSQREVYWIALGVAVAALLALRLRPDVSLRRAVPWLLALIFFVGFLVAGYHAGVEWKRWPGPESCAVGSTNVAAMKALAAGGEVRTISCDEAAWVFAGLSMAGWNALASLAFAALGLVAARREAARD